jgi:membrane associated rhomboid family serine protease
MLGSFNITDVVKNLLIINVFMFIATNIEPLIYYHDYFILWNPFWDSAAFPYNSKQDIEFMGFQVVTHMFMHGGVSHIFFNMMMLVLCGPIVEARLGPKKFFIFYFASGLGAVGLYMLVNYFTMDNPQDLYRMLGASGAIYGVMVGAALTDPNRRIMLLIPPIPIRLIYLVGIALSVDVFYGFKDAVGSNTAYFAHIGGAFMGYILLEYIMPKINV